MKALDPALTDGPCLIDTSPATRAFYSRTTLPFSYRPSGVAYPTSTEEVEALVTFARERRIPLYPISRGKNWGYGDAMAPGEGYLIVDLGKMNRIIEVNTRLAYAVIEPGVTQGQLYEYLKKHAPKLWMDANGAGPDASLVGNFLERGFGHTPIGERASQCAGMEVVLGTGELLRTGFGHYPGAKATHLYKHGIGPALDGLFFQSSYGIVTRLGIWLMPKPEAFGAFFVRSREEADLGPLVDKISSLRLSGVVRNCVHLGNTLRALSAQVPYPWDEAGERAPVDEATLRKWGAAYGIGAWNASGAVYGPALVVEASLATIRDALAGFDVVTLDDDSLSKLDPAIAGALRPAIGLLQGAPTDVYLRGASWRSRAARSSSPDPLDNGAGLLWAVPALPATASDAVAVKGIIRATIENHGFDAPITFTFINERTLTATTNVSYDRSDAEESKVALECQRELIARLIEAGYPPYRGGVGGYDLLNDGSVFWKTARELKAVLDPDGIISPGRYFGGRGDA